MGRFDKMCNEVDKNLVVRKRKYTYKLNGTAYPGMYIIFRATNESADAEWSRTNDDGTLIWMPYAMRVKGRWKKIVLLDACN